MILYFDGLVFAGFRKLKKNGGIKQCKCIVILRDLPYNSALFWLVA